MEWRQCDYLLVALDEGEALLLGHVGAEDDHGLVLAQAGRAGRHLALLKRQRGLRGRHPEAAAAEPQPRAEPRLVADLLLVRAAGRGHRRAAVEGRRVAGGDRAGAGGG